MQSKQKLEQTRFHANQRLVLLGSIGGVCLSTSIHANFPIFFFSLGFTLIVWTLLQTIKPAIVFTATHLEINKYHYSIAYQQIQTYLLQGKRLILFIENNNAIRTIEINLNMFLPAQRIVIIKKLNLLKKIQDESGNTQFITTHRALVSKNDTLKKEKAPRPRMSFTAILAISVLLLIEILSLVGTYLLALDLQVLHPDPASTNILMVIIFIMVLLLVWLNIGLFKGKIVALNILVIAQLFSMGHAIGSFIYSGFHLDGLLPILIFQTIAWISIGLFYLPQAKKWFDDCTRSNFRATFHLHNERL